MVRGDKIFSIMTADVFHLDLMTEDAPKILRSTTRMLLHFMAQKVTEGDQLWQECHVEICAKRPITSTKVFKRVFAMVS